MKESKMKYANIVLSAIAICVSIATAVVFYCRRNECIYFDSSAFYGCLIAVLAILVTALIGFQIMNYLSFEEKFNKRIDELVSATDKKTNDSAIAMNKTVDDKIEKLDNRIGAVMLHSKANYYTSSNAPKSAIADYVNAIECAQKAQMSSCDIIDDLSLHLTSIEDKNKEYIDEKIQLTEDEIKLLVDVLGRCNISNGIIDRIKKLKKNTE